MNLNYTLVINGGSSSIKFSILRQLNADVASTDLNSFASQTAGLIKRSNNKWKLLVPGQAEAFIAPADLPVPLLVAYLKKSNVLEQVTLIGHRIVQGHAGAVPEIVTQEVLARLGRQREVDPDHIPLETDLIEQAAKLFPGITQFVCYDTSFHEAMPELAKQLPIPERFGLKRLGFHGLSYQYLLLKLKSLDEGAAQGKIIIAHLGGGASLSAIDLGKPLDTTMGFTPSSGIMMGSRPGDLDPGVIAQMIEKENLSVIGLAAVINHECGLLAVSEESADMEELASKKHMPRVQLAIDLFCYQVRKQIGAYSAALGGLDTLIFSGGIGEKDHSLRWQICQNMDFLGLALDEEENTLNSEIISKKGSKITVRVIQTNEELMIALTGKQIVTHDR